MKVKELIEKLSVLDQDKDIYVFYDMYAAIEPGIVQAKEDMQTNEFHIKSGDYYIEAW